MVSMYGDRWVARTSASLLVAADLGELVVGSWNEYIGLAQRLASPDHRAQLVQMRQGMREKLRSSKVCDTGAFAKQMESLFESFLANPRE